VLLEPGSSRMGGLDVSRRPDHVHHAFCAQDPPAGYVLDQDLPEQRDPGSRAQWVQGFDGDSPLLVIGVLEALEEATGGIVSWPSVFL
jgi:hypothetical protein